MDVFEEIANYNAKDPKFLKIIHANMYLEDVVYSVVRDTVFDVYCLREKLCILLELVSDDVKDWHKREYEFNTQEVVDRINDLAKDRANVKMPELEIPCY